MDGDFTRKLPMSVEAEQAVLDYAAKVKEEWVGDHDFARLTGYVVGDLEGRSAP